MADNPSRPGSEWSRFRPEVIEALRGFLTALETDGSLQDLSDTYLSAKRKSAEAMQARTRLDLPERCDTFHDMRDRLRQEAVKRYSGAIPEKYLRIPYGSRVHEELFSVLLARRGTPVRTDQLRIVTADSIHTERRTRELRELGLDIEASKSNGLDVYTLESLQVDTSKVASIVKNNIEKDKKVLPPDERQRYLAALTD
jgi:hypothetical protein